MFNLKSAFVILVVFLLPFCLRFVGFEPYPAILLPSGASKIKKADEKISFEVTKLYALNERGNWAEIDQKQFMSPIPVYYLDYILDQNLGLNKRSVNTEELYHWIKDKLAAQKLQGTEMKITTYTTTFSLNSKTVIGSKIKNEKIISLLK
jgi:hypothetical protein